MRGLTDCIFILTPKEHGENLNVNAKEYVKMTNRIIAFSFSLHTYVDNYNAIVKLHFHFPVYVIILI